MSKKKIIILGSIVSVLVLAIALFLIFVVFKHEHTWTERTCTEGVYCTECNKIKQKYGYGHDYGEWIEIIESTCTSNGTKERSCKRCGEKESVTVRARGYHDYGNWTTVQEASCTVDGRKERTCTCGEKDTMTIKASHQYEKGICTKCGKGVIDITLPNTPLTVHYTYLGRINASVKIISIRWEIKDNNKDGTKDITIYWSGEKTYNSSTTHSFTCFIAYKLYDSNGYVVASGADIPEDVAVGEKFKDASFIIQGLDPNESYTLEILDYGS